MEANTFLGHVENQDKRCAASAIRVQGGETKERTKQKRERMDETGGLHKRNESVLMQIDEHDQALQTDARDESFVVKRTKQSAKA